MQLEGNRIKVAKYNRYYKQFGAQVMEPKYLGKKVMEDPSRSKGVRTLIRLRCDNVENYNKY